MTFQNMCIIALADGILDPAERALLEEIADAMGLSPEQARDLIDRAHALDFIIPVDEGERHMELRMVVLMMLSDGKLTPDEYAGCRELTERMGIDLAYLDDVIAFYQGKQQERLKHIGIFQNLYIIAAADGAIDEAEHALLTEVAYNLGLGQRDIDQVQEDYAADELNMVVPEGEEDRYYSLKNLLYMMVVNGEIDEREFALCVAFAEACGLGIKEIDEILAEYEELRISKVEARSEAAGYNLDVYLDIYNALKAIPKPTEQMADAMIFALRTHDFSRAVSSQEEDVRAFYSWLWLACVRCGRLQQESLQKLPLYLDLARDKGHFQDHLDFLIEIEQHHGASRLTLRDMSLLEIQTALDRELKRAPALNLLW